MLYVLIILVESTCYPGIRTEQPVVWTTFAKGWIKLLLVRYIFTYAYDPPESRYDDTIIAYSTLRNKQWVSTYCQNMGYM